jgi:predicted transcriptional regulator
MVEDVMLSLTAQIVSAHVAHNTADPADLPKLINDVHRALATAGQPAPPQRGEPAVAVSQSVKADHLVCLECGQKLSLLKRHLRTDHQLTPEDYRQKWELPRSYPLVAPDYTKIRSGLAKRIGLGRLPGNTGRKGTRRPAR